MSTLVALASGGAEGGDPRHHVEAFLGTLAALGYVEDTRRAKQRILERLVRWMGESGIGTADLDESVLGRYLERVVRRPYRRGRVERATLLGFLDHLREEGATPPRRPLAPSPGEILVERYREHLRDAKGLSARSLAVYTPVVRRFVLATALEEAGSVDDVLDATTVRRCLLEQVQGRSSEMTKLTTVALRSFLRFLFLYGKTARDLSSSVPTVRRWQLASVPPILSADEVERVLEVPDPATPQGRRDRAMLLLLARLGLRPGEVAKLELDDIDWVRGEIVVRGKGGSADRLPLPEDVGEALARYLREDRGRASSRRVFLRLLAPRVGLSGPWGVSAVATQAMGQAGIRTGRRAGGHLFRHSLATRMIRRGASLVEISQILRHRSTTTTWIYAKVDFESLRGVARSWPGVGGEA